MTQPPNSKSKKMCLMGASAVGKTSLVKRFVEGKFDETYRTTIGVHIDSKAVTCDEEHVKLIIWDLEGTDDLRSEYPSTYLGGAQGYMLVADVTRPETLDVAKGILSTILRHCKKESSPPFVLLINKQDILQSPAVTNRAFEICGDGTKLFQTSAKTGDVVNEAFECLVRQMLFEHSESTEVATASLDERALFDDLFRGLDSLVLERSTEGHAFRPIHTVPEWAHGLITQNSDQPGQDLWIVCSHFLEDYVLRAMPWWDQLEGGEFPSESWEEESSSEGRLDLEAVATAIGAQKLLVIKRGASCQRTYKQIMREKRINVDHRSSEL